VERARAWTKEGLEDGRVSISIGGKRELNIGKGQWEKKGRQTSDLLRQKRKSRLIKFVGRKKLEQWSALGLR